MLVFHESRWVIAGLKGRFHISPVIRTSNWQTIVHKPLLNRLEAP